MAALERDRMGSADGGGAVIVALFFLCVKNGETPINPILDCLPGANVYFDMNPDG